MYTILNLFVLLLFYQNASEYVRDIMRASTFLIAVVVATSVWTNPFSVYKALFDSFAPPKYQATVPLNTKYGIVFIFDMLFHVIPLVVIGLPHNSISMLIACTILLAWYAVMRHRIHEIYTSGISTDRSICIAIVTALIGYILLEK
jgi:hypothetical protein